MSDSAKRVIIALVTLAAAVAVVLFLVKSCDQDSSRSALKSSSGSSKSLSDESSKPDDTSSTASVAPTSSPSVADDSDDDDEDSPHNDVKDDPAPPTSGGAGGSKTSTAWQRYLSATKAIVTDNRTDLNASFSDAISAITEDDSTALSALMAPDEGAGLPNANAVVDSYPSILRSRTTNTVSIFTVGGATIYYAHAVVDWQDGGIISQHTISVPMRFIAGDWYISTIDLNTPGLVSVQSVQL